MVEKLTGHYWEGSYSIKHRQAKKFRMGSLHRIASSIGMSTTHLARKCKKLGIYKPKVRAGMCDYCVAQSRKETPLTKRIEEEFKTKLDELGCDWMTEWEKEAKEDPQFAADNFYQYESPKYWLAAFSFLDQKVKGSSNADKEAADLTVKFIERFKETRLEQIKGFQAHLQLRDNQDAAFAAVDMPSKLPPGKMCTACDFGDPGE